MEQTVWWQVLENQERAGAEVSIDSLKLEQSRG